MKRNSDNDGRAFEKDLLDTVAYYRASGRMDLEKVTPPVRTFKNAFGKTEVRFMRNPFLDLIGSWNAQNGRLVMIEAKSTKEPILPIGDGGIREAQRQMLVRWHITGAAVGVVWSWTGRGYSFIPCGQIEKTYRQGVHHIKWDDCEEVTQGDGFAYVDFETCLARWYPPFQPPEKL